VWFSELFVVVISELFVVAGRIPYVAIDGVSGARSTRYILELRFPGVFSSRSHVSLRQISAQQLRQIILKATLLFNAIESLNCILQILQVKECLGGFVVHNIGFITDKPNKGR
jgi:hypothetical protein